MGGALSSAMSSIGRMATVASGGTFQDPKKGMLNLFTGIQNDAGVAVNTHTAMALSAVYCAVRVLSESMGVLPLEIMQQVGDGREVAKQHPLYLLLHSEPNDLMDSYTLRETMMVHCTLWGNAYAIIDFDARGRATRILPIEPWRVKPELNKETMTMKYTIDNRQVYDQAEILHIKGLGNNGLVGKSVIEYASQDFGLALAAQKFAARFYGNGTNMGGWIESEKAIGPQAFDRLKEQLEGYQGPENSHRTPIFDNGQVYKTTKINAREMQMIESRKHEIEEVSRWFRIPQHMLQNLDRATFSNIEHQDLQFIKYTLLSWVKKFEMELNRKLLRDSEKLNTTFKFNMDVFLRADLKTRYEAYNLGISSGWLTRKNARDMENQNPISGLEKPLVALNMGILEDDGSVTAPAKQATTEKR